MGMLQIKVLTESSVFSGSEIVGQNSQSVYVIESVTLADQILQGHRDAAEAAAAAAYQSEINAANSAAAAAASELQTDEDRRAVENDKLLTAGYRDEAAASAAAADTSEANAKTSETNAATSASNAAASATSASGSASTATQKATEAATSASAAAADADRSQVAADEATQMLDDFRNVSSVSGNLAVGGTISEAGVNLGNKYAEIAYVDQSIADLIGGAPETLDTLEEIAAILAENDSAMDSMLTLIDTKLAKDGSTPMTGNLLMGNKNINGVGGIVFNDETTSNSEGIRWPTSAATPTVYDGIHAAGGYLYFNDTKKVYHEGYKPSPSAIGAVNKAGDTMTGQLNINSVTALSTGLALIDSAGVKLLNLSTGHLGQAVFYVNDEHESSLEGLLFRTIGNGGTGKADMFKMKPGGEIYADGGTNRVYHQGFKPTTGELGAVAKAGDTMTGTLRAPTIDTDSIAFGAATIVKTDEGISFNV